MLDHFSNDFSVDRRLFSAVELEHGQSIGAAGVAWARIGSQTFDQR
jgi:hypothetical protein